MRQKIAFLGLGAMGSRMATRLISAGYDVTVWNRSPDRVTPLVAAGGGTAETPGAAVEGADVVLAMLRDDTASGEVWLDPRNGAFEKLRPGTIVIECSTLSLSFVRRLEEEATARGLRFLDAPVAGSRPQAEAGQLVFMVGGGADTLAEVHLVLAAMGGSIHHAGAAGAGATVKLAVNALLGTQVAAAAELVGLIDEAGIDTARAFEIIGETPVASPALKGAAGSMLAGAFAPMFPVDLVEKDLGYVEAAAAQTTPLTSATRAVMQRAMAAGLSEENLTGIVRLYRPPAGTR